VLADEEGFSHSDRGQAEEEAEMAGDAESARVRDPLSVREDEVGPPR
jgi:hypothetical protein